MAFGADVYAVILAGGSGTRFWPKSRQKSPKQLCKLGPHTQTMIEITLGRLEGVVPPERRIIVTHRDQVAETRRIVGARCAHIIAEPAAKNTANALALAALEIRTLAGKKGAVMMSFHADHLIKDVERFTRSLEDACWCAAQGFIALIGVVPGYAETGYGYIEKGAALARSGSFKVASFREKPDRTTAEKYVKSGQFFWNAGLFVLPVDLFLEELTAQLPQNMQLLSALQQKGSFTTADEKVFAEVYGKLQSISVDHAVFEKSSRIAVVEADIGWQDVGSWDALALSFPTDAKQNLALGDTLLIDSSSCVVEGDGAFVAAIGVKDLVIVHAKGAVLVCPKDRAQDVKLIVEKLKESGRSELI